MKTLLHAMGDVHPHALKGLLAKELSQLTFEQWWYEYKKCKREKFDSTWFESGKTIFCNSGFEAVEAALKTAFLATRKRGVIAFEGAYHGLGYGALDDNSPRTFSFALSGTTGWLSYFANFPVTQSGLKQTLKQIRAILRKHKIGAILVEPIQVRAGVRIPADGFLQALRAITEEKQIVLIYDEIYTGFGRTGTWFALRPSNRAAGYCLPRQGAHWRFSAFGLRRTCDAHGRRVAADFGRGHPYEHLSWSSSRLRNGACTN